MSQDGQDRPSVLRAARERTRAEITRQILDAARRHLATEGASGLSLRAIARELGASSSAVYRYVASRDDLLTRLIVAAYDALGAAAETAEAAVARDDLAGRWSAVCGAVRAWALANPNEYALIYGTPVPGYTAPPATIAPAARVSSVLLGILAGAAAGRPTPAMAGDDVPPAGRKALAPAGPSSPPRCPTRCCNGGSWPGQRCSAPCRSSCSASSTASSATSPATARRSSQNPSAAGRRTSASPRPARPTGPQAPTAAGARRKLRQPPQPGLSKTAPARPRKKRAHDLSPRGNPGQQACASTPNTPRSWSPRSWPSRCRS